MKSLLNIAKICFGLAAISATIQVRADQEYDWTGGAPGYSGAIVLDSNSNASGTIGDIVSGEITTPQGEFVFNPATVYIQLQAFNWNPDQITEMWFIWYYGSNPPDGGDPGANGNLAIAAFGENLNAFSTKNGDEDFIGTWVLDSTIVPYDSSWDTGDATGSWTAVNQASGVPDGGKTVNLLGGAFFGLAALRRRFAKGRPPNFKSLQPT